MAKVLAGSDTLNATDTIYALASGAGLAGINVVRVSGSTIRAILTDLAGTVPAPRKAHLADLKAPDDSVIDQALVLFFPGPASFTGEDVAELHIHGGRATLLKLFDVLSAQPNTRMAQAGEFTRRALINGKLDLTQAEGLLDLIHAETELQREQALGQTLGNASDTLEDWRRELISCRSMIEAELDFSDEEDVPGSLLDAFEPKVRALADAIRRALDDGNRGEILRDGYRVVLVGAPNVGKSSILNALAKRDVAIVSDEAGTTRDTLEVRLDLNGIPVIVTDTAGLRETDSKVEQEGIRRTLSKAAEADLVLHISEAGANDESEVSHPNAIIIANKGDLSAKPDPEAMLTISATTGANLSGLIDLISVRASEHLAGGEPAIITRARHRELLGDTLASLDHLLANPEAELELKAEDLRMASVAIGRITGRIDVEDVLDELFASFCIGK